MGAPLFVDLDHVIVPTAFLEASAREVASLFPGHLNVVTGAVLAGLGLDRTQVVQIAGSDDYTAWFQSRQFRVLDRSQSMSMAARNCR